MLAGEHGQRLSRAGAQSKLPVLLIDGQVALPAPGQPTSKSLKRPGAGIPATIKNEHFFMSLTRPIGLDVAPVEMRTVGGRSFQLIARYDRVVGPSRELVRRGATRSPRNILRRLDAAISNLIIGHGDPMPRTFVTCTRTVQ
jgi:serine/threonine-protein kinase HipA